MLVHALAEGNTPLPLARNNIPCIIIHKRVHESIGAEDDRGVQRMLKPLFPSHDLTRGYADPSWFLR